VTELDRATRELVERGKALDGPEPGRREAGKRMLLASLAGAGATLTATAGSAMSAAGAAKGVASLSMTSIFIIGFTAGVAVTVPSVIVAMRTPAPAVVASSSTAPSARSAMGSPSSRSHRSLGAAPEEASTRGSADTGVGSRGLAPGAAEAPAPDERPESSFSAEARLLQAAQRSLAAGQAVRAWELLSDHARRFPHGALGDERDAAFVLAACALGHEDDARRRRDALAARAPTSPFLPRLERSCVGVRTREDRR
jgi:hypothetical protein